MTSARGAGFFATFAGVTFRPGRFFARPPESRSRWPPFLFAITVGAVAGSVSSFAELMILGQPLKISLLVALGVALASPILRPVSLAIEAALLHLLLILVGGRHRPFGETFRALCWAEGPRLLGAIPFVGLVGEIWSLVTAAIAVRHLQSTTPGRATAAVLGVPILFIGAALGLRLFVVEAFKIPAGSMIPTLQVGDHIFLDKLAYAFRAPSRGEVIVFRYPRDPSKDFVKRIVAVGGDTVEIRDGAVWLNGAPIPRRKRDGDCSYQDYDEYDAHWATRRCQAWDETLDGTSYRVITDPDRRPSSFAPVAIPDGEVYVLGDNRDNSHDSRYWGTVAGRLVKGRVGTIWWSRGPEGIRTARIGTRVR